MRRSVKMLLGLALMGIVAAGGFAAGQSESTGTDSEQVSFESAPVVDIYWDGDVGAKLQEMGVDLEDNVWYRYVYEQTGVRPVFTWIPAQGYFEKMRLVTASKEEFDLFRGDRVVNWIKNRSLQQLDDLLEQYGPNILKTVPEAALAKVTYQGSIYGIPIPEHRIVKQVLLIRADWFDQLDMETPDTIAEFEQFLRAVRRSDLNGNGQNDEYGLTMDKDWSDTFLFTGAWGAAPNWGDSGTFVDFDNRQIKLWAATDEAREYFATFARWWEEGLVDPESLSQDRYSGQKAKFTSGTAATYRDSILDAVTYEADLTNLLGPGPNVVPLPPLRGTDRAGYMNNPAIDRTIFMNAYAADKEAAMQFADFFMSPDGISLSTIGIEGVDHQIVDGKVQMASWGETEMIRQLGRFSALSADQYYANLEENLATRFAGFLANPGRAQARAAENIGWHDEANAEWGYKGYWEWQDDIVVNELMSARTSPDWLSPLPEYRLKFLTGELDAMNDRDWQAFQNALEAAGTFRVLDEASEVWFQDVYSRNPGYYDRFAN